MSFKLLLVLEDTSNSDFTTSRAIVRILVWRNHTVVLPLLIRGDIAETGRLHFHLRRPGNFDRTVSRYRVAWVEHDCVLSKLTSFIIALRETVRKHDVREFLISDSFSQITIKLCHIEVVFVFNEDV